jgi:hypothetical protein
LSEFLMGAAAGPATPQALGGTEADRKLLARYAHSRGLTEDQ